MNPEPMTGGSVATGLIGFAFLLGAVFIFLWYWWELGSRWSKQEAEYEAKHSRILGYLETWEVDAENYQILKDEINSLGQLKWKDREKTRKIAAAFFIKYREETKKASMEKSLPLQK